MIAVVTGSSGFLGRNLVERLLRDGHTVRALVRPNGGSAPAGCERFVVDYRRFATLVNTPAFEGADVVFHLAGVTRANRPRDFRTGNVEPTRHVLGALVARRLRPRVVFVSSQAAAGPAASLRHPVTETDPPRPVEEYGRSKLEAERVVLGFADRLPITTVRPCAVFGPWDRDFAIMFRLARRGILVYPGTRQHWLSILHVDDVVDGLVLAAASERAICRTFFLASDDPAQWSTIGKEIARACGGAVELNLPRSVVSATSLVAELVGRVFDTVTLANTNKAALSKDPFWVCTAERARSELGWVPGRSLPEAIRDTYLWYDANGWVGTSVRGGSVARTS